MCHAALRGGRGNAPLSRGIRPIKHDMCCFMGTFNCGTSVTSTTGVYFQGMSQKKQKKGMSLWPHLGEEKRQLNLSEIDSPDVS